MVVAGVAAQRQRPTGRGAGGLEALRLQLRFEETVGEALVDEDRPRVGMPAHQLAGVVRGPRVAVVAEVARERLLPPRHLRRRDDRRDRRHAAVAAGMPQREHQRPVAAHRMPADAGALEVGRELGGQQGRQLVDDMRLHPEPRRPRRLRRVEVEAGTFAEFPVAGGAFDTGVARAGVRRHDHHSQLGGDALHPRLHRRGLLRAREPGEEHQHRYAAVARLRRHVHAEAHRPAARRGSRPVEPLRAAEAAVLRQRLDRHVSTPPRCGSTRHGASGRTRR